MWKIFAETSGKTDLNLNLFQYFWKTTFETVKPIFKPQPSFLKNNYIFGVFVDSSRAFNLLQISPHLEVLLFATCYCLLFGGVFIQNCLIFLIRISRIFFLLFLNNRFTVFISDNNRSRQNLVKTINDLLAARVSRFFCNQISSLL